MSRRPFGVTLVALIAWITGLLQIVSGVFTIFSPAGWIAIVVGIVTIVVSFGLFGGNNGARILAAIVFAINVIGSIYLLFTFQTSFWSALWSGIFPLIGLLLLFTRSANAFFARR